MCAHHTLTRDHFRFVLGFRLKGRAAPQTFMTRVKIQSQVCVSQTVKDHLTHLVFHRNDIKGGLAVFDVSVFLLTLIQAISDPGTSQ